MQTVGLLGRGISPSQGRYLHAGQHKHRINTHIDIHALSGIRTHDPSIQASDDGACLRPLGHRERLINPTTYPKPVCSHFIHVARVLKISLAFLLFQLRVDANLTSSPNIMIQICCLFPHLPLPPHRHITSWCLQLNRNTHNL
jgi:hypothetical protein